MVLSMARASLCVLLLMVVCCAVRGKPLNTNRDINPVEISIPGGQHTVQKRFVNPALTLGDFTGNGLSKIRARRNAAEDCEKLQLCKLHARASHNFFAAYELYFVNKENARLWDHRSRSAAECRRRFTCYR